MFNNRIRGVTQVHIMLVSVCTVAWLFVYALLAEYMGWFVLLSTINYFQYILCLIVGVVLSLQAMSEARTHLTDLSPRDNFRLTFVQIGSSALMMFTLSFVVRDRDMSRLFLATYLASLCPLLMMLNALAPRRIAKLLYAWSPQIPTLILTPVYPTPSVPFLLSQRHLGFSFVGLLCSSNPTNTPLPVLGSLDTYPQVIGKHGIQQVIITDLQKFPPQDLEELILTCQQMGCRVLMQDQFSVNARIPLTLIQQGEASFYVPMSEPLEEPLSRLEKRILDIIVSLPIVIFVLPPAMLLVKIMQAIQSPGPLFKLQSRGGHANNPFTVFKFRSMHQDIKHVMVGEAKQATNGDPRIYPFGAWIRRTSLDEVPQFINVLLGNMSIVGPRPHLVVHDSSFAQQSRQYRVRQYVKPGVTGWAQIHGFRGEITCPDALEKRVQYDLYYIHHWSIYLDLEILVRTVGVVLNPPPTAY